MVSRFRSPPVGGAFRRRFGSYEGLYFDDFDTGSAWIREHARLELPSCRGGRSLVLRGAFRPHPAARGMETSFPGLVVSVNGRPAGSIAALNPGPWKLNLNLLPEAPNTISLRLTGVGFTNFLAWLGRITGLGPLQRFRTQSRNRQLRIASLETAGGEPIFDFSRRDAPLSADYIRRHVQLGLNIAGFLTADLGIGESARCMVRAADAAGLPCALIQLKLNCKNRLGDGTYAARLQDDNPHPVNVIHVDPPASRDIDHHHGRDFRAGKYNIGYFAWELPEFPDAWLPSFDFYDEIWCPSDFTAAAIRQKSPVPVLTMPHAIAFPRPVEAMAQLRARFGLPNDSFLFLTLFDLNSYAVRKNPGAVIEAFRQAALPSTPSSAAPAKEGLPSEALAKAGCALVIKAQNTAGNEAAFAALRQGIRDLPGAILLTDTLSRADTYALEAACDAFVSLHRSEGFGLAVAECMYLGKPVISTDWSATKEYVTEENGCPVRARLAALGESHGPYARGSTWADPDPTHAATWMQELYADRALAARLGAAARLTVEERFAPAVIGERYRRRLEAIAAF